jgi:hypothetical protein
MKRNLPNQIRFSSHYDPFIYLRYLFHLNFIVLKDVHNVHNCKLHILLFIKCQADFVIGTPIMCFKI